MRTGISYIQMHNFGFMVNMRVRSDCLGIMMVHYIETVIDQLTYVTMRMVRWSRNVGIVMVYHIETVIDQLKYGTIRMVR